MGPINKTPIKDTLKKYLLWGLLKMFYYGAYKRHPLKKYLNIIMGFIKNVKKKCYLYFS